MEPEIYTAEPSDSSQFRKDHILIKYNSREKRGEMLSCFAKIHRSTVYMIGKQCDLLSYSAIKHAMQTHLFFYHYDRLYTFLRS
jgi:hypothetical protein